MKQGQKKQEDQVITMAKSHLKRALVELRAKDGFKKLGAAEQGAVEATCIATVISHRVLDITVDEQGGMFFQTSQAPLAEDIIRQLNEDEIMDVDYITSLMFPLWNLRYQLAIGKQSPWDYHRHLEEWLPKPKVGIMKLLLDIQAGS